MKRQQTTQSHLVSRGLFQLGIGTQVGLDRGVLLEEEAQVRHQILEHRHVRQRIDFDGGRTGRKTLVNWRQTRQAVGARNVHRAAATDALATRAPQRERRILHENAPSTIQGQKQRLPRTCSFLILSSASSTIGPHCNRTLVSRTNLFFTRCSPP
jgi:hypothetical protein